MASPEEVAAKSPSHVLQVNSGARVDTSAQVVPVIDISNLVLSPDGSTLVVRGGLELRGRTNIDRTGSANGKIVIIKNSAPPDVNLGNMFTVYDENGAMVDISFMRDRTQLEGSPFTSTVSIYPEAPIGPMDVNGETSGNSAVLGTATVERVGDLSFPATILLQVLSTDYPATPQQLSTWMAANPATMDVGESSIDIDFRLFFPAPGVPNVETTYYFNVTLLVSSNSIVSHTRNYIVLLVHVVEI